MIEARFLPLITLMSGIAVCDALAETGLAPDIKWVNDILVNEKKISGILAETVDTANGLAVVVGIGVNLRSSNYPPDVAIRATSIEAEGGKIVSADEFAAMLARRISHFYPVLCHEGGPSRIIDEWRRRSSYFSGTRVRVVLPNETIEGTTDGLEENGSLRVRQIDGRTIIVQAGDVESVRATPLAQC
jgi:BirA family biotin operon repressor/biotin-[acetyl-CoA-carboxylase] ligase